MVWSVQQFVPPPPKPPVELFVERKSTLDLLDQKKVFDFLKQNNFDEIYIAAAKVGWHLCKQ